MLQLLQLGTNMEANSYPIGGSPSWNKRYIDVLECTHRKGNIKDSCKKTYERCGDSMKETPEDQRDARNSRWKNQPTSRGMSPSIMLVRQPSPTAVRQTYHCIDTYLGRHLYNIVVNTFPNS